MVSSVIANVWVALSTEIGAENAGTEIVNRYQITSIIFAEEYSPAENSGFFSTDPQNIQQMRVKPVITTETNNTNERTMNTANQSGILENIWLNQRLSAVDNEHNPTNSRINVSLPS